MTAAPLSPNRPTHEPTADEFLLDRLEAHFDNYISGPGYDVLTLCKEFRKRDAEVAALREQVERVQNLHTGLMTEADKRYDELAASTNDRIAAAVAAERERAERFRDRMLLFENALGHIRWVKDCGIHSVNDNGTLHNHPAEERDSMYEIAGKALAGEPCCEHGARAPSEPQEQKR